MKITSEQFKDIICKINRISPSAKITFRAKVWHGTREESDFDIETFSGIEKIIVKFRSDSSEKDEIIICLN